MYVFKTKNNFFFQNAMGKFEIFKQFVHPILD